MPGRARTRAGYRVKATSHKKTTTNVYVYKPTVAHKPATPRKFKNVTLIAREQSSLEARQRKQEQILLRQATVESDIEKVFKSWLVDKEEEFDFESDLLGGRVGLSFIRAPFILNSDSVIRFFEQEDSLREGERIQLECLGFNVFDIAPMKIANSDETFEKVLEEVYPNRVVSNK